MTGYHGMERGGVNKDVSTSSFGYREECTDELECFFI